MYAFGTIVGTQIILFALFFKDNWLRKKGEPLTDFQKFTLISIASIIVILIIVAMIVLILQSSFYGSKNTIKIENEYINQMAYYQNKIDLSLKKMGQEMKNKDYFTTNKTILEYVAIRKEMIRKLFEICDKAANQSINLGGSKALDEMNITCNQRELQIKCIDEEYKSMMMLTDYIKNFKKKTRTDCYLLALDLEYMQSCEIIQKEIGNPIEDSSSIIRKSCPIVPEQIPPRSVIDELIL